MPITKELTMTETIIKPRARRGFAAMSPERRREIARKGGGSVPPEKRSFAKNRDLAQSAGSKGGSASRGGGRTRKPKAVPATLPGEDPT
jgi:general stress protein YciG